MARGRPGKDQHEVLMKSAEFIGWALGGIEREIGQTKVRLAALIAQATQLRSRISGGAAAAPAAASKAAQPAKRGRRRRSTMSPEARKRLSDMMKKRWAERKKNAK